MPQAHLRVPVIKNLLGNMNDADYNAARETLNKFIVNIGM